MAASTCDIFCFCFFCWLVRIQLDIHIFNGCVLWCDRSSVGRVWGLMDSLPALPFTRSCSLTRRVWQSKLQRHGPILVRHLRNNHLEAFAGFFFSFFNFCNSLQNFTVSSYLDGNKSGASVTPAVVTGQQLLHLWFWTRRLQQGSISFSLVDLNRNTLGEGATKHYCVDM